ncbi:hypothetical protein [Metapseudomonas otitidis]|uniref:hypothetical protein n=1 Tax=Metapseudomonas otitidis TaxID=319939 RepID=UPI001F365DA4|nr:hypothetical protein [Pseudomonas otitidis]
MVKRILIALVLACWLGCTSFAIFYLAPVMFFSQRPEMVLIAFLAPALWLICSVLAFIAWADAGWPPEHRSSAHIRRPRPRLHFKELNT